MDHDEFKRRGAAIICVAPHGVGESRLLVEELQLPFPVLADDNRAVFLKYHVQSRVWSLGQRPGLYVIDRHGKVRWAHVGGQQWDIPRNARVLEVLDVLNRVRAVLDTRSEVGVGSATPPDARWEG